MQVNGFADWYEQCKRYFPAKLRQATVALDAQVLAAATELRFGVGRQAEIYCGKRRHVLPDVENPGQPLQLNSAECRYFFNMITAYSPYAYIKTLREGFVTLPNGCRVGVAGVYNDDPDAGLEDYACSSFSLRIAREVPGVAQPVLDHIYRGERVRNTLVISPPGYGKTTFLRDIARLLSQAGQRVCIVDERMEIAGFYNGHPQFDIGGATDVVSGCAKSQGIIKALRVLAPQVIITDEIGAAQDAHAIAEAGNSGVAVVASTHGYSIDDIRKRATTGPMLSQGLFETLIVLHAPWEAGKAPQVCHLGRKKASGDAV